MNTFGAVGGTVGPGVGGRHTGDEAVHLRGLRGLPTLVHSSHTDQGHAHTHGATKAHPDPERHVPEPQGPGLVAGGTIFTNLCLCNHFLLYVNTHFKLDVLLID